MLIFWCSKPKLVIVNLVSVFLFKILLIKSVQWSWRPFMYLIIQLAFNARKKLLTLIMLNMSVDSTIKKIVRDPIFCFVHNFVPIVSNKIIQNKLDTFNGFLTYDIQDSNNIGVLRKQDWFTYSYVSVHWQLIRLPLINKIFSFFVYSV